MKTCLNYFILLAICVLFGKPAFSQHSNYEPGELIIKWKSSALRSQKEGLKDEIHFKKASTFSQLDLEHIKIGVAETRSVETLIETYKQHPAIEFIEPNYIYSIQNVIPNDPHFDNQWGLHNSGQNDGTPDADIDAPEAWEIATDCDAVVVAIIDSGIDWTHEDLAENIWQNLGEDADGDGSVLQFIDGIWQFDPDDNNGIDDDNNGYADDFIGWDFYNNDNNPLDDNSHGTHVAGIIGAKGNNGRGIAGVCWNVQLAALKAFGPNGLTNAGNTLNALNYAIEMGIPISNNSWGGGPNSTALYQAIQNAENNDHLFIAAAGNLFLNLNPDNDIDPFYPASYNQNNIISVIATDRNDNLANTSNFGLTTTDIGAPGKDIYSCLPNNSYGNLSGTSMATPMVTGTAALLWALYPEMNYAEIKEAILTSGTAVSGLNGITATGKRLNLNQALYYFTGYVSARERDSLALVALHNATDGTDWHNVWNLNQPMDSWYGVTMDDDDRISTLDLNQNGLYGSIPNEIGNLSHLSYLDLGRNTLTGYIPAELWNLINLIHLDLSGHDFEGDLSPEIGNLASLTHLNLESSVYFGYDPSLTGTIPSELWNLTNLSYLNLSKNSWSGNLSPEIGNLINLNSLDITGLDAGCGLSGILPYQLGHINGLGYVNLSYNNFSGCFPTSFYTFCNWTYHFYNNPGLPDEGELDNFCSGESGFCPNGDCSYSDSLALVALDSAIGLNWNLNEPMYSWPGVYTNGENCVVKLEFSNLSGTIPDEIGNLSNLTHLTLINSSLTGSIPNSIGDLANLVYLDLSNNTNLNGPIP